MVMGELFGPPVGDEKAGVAERELPSDTINISWLLTEIKFIPLKM